MMNEPCEHKWIFQESHYSKEWGSYQNEYKKMDIYYCEKCLERKEILRSEYSRGEPLWWMH
jgi:hypothetical protein